LVVSDAHHEERIKAFGTSVDEREQQQKLPEWAQRTDLTGWVRGNEAVDPEVMNELVRLSQENRELRASSSAPEETFDGLTLEELVRLMRERALTAPESHAFLQLYSVGNPGEVTARNLLEAFEVAFEHMLARRPAALGDAQPVVQDFIDSESWRWWKIITDGVFTSLLTPPAGLEIGLWL
jgi:hypothetical protein